MGLRDDLIKMRNLALIGAISASSLNVGAQTINQDNLNQNNIEASKSNKSEVKGADYYFKQAQKSLNDIKPGGGMEQFYAEMDAIIKAAKTEGCYDGLFRDSSLSAKLFHENKEEFDIVMSKEPQTPMGFLIGMIGDDAKTSEIGTNAAANIVAQAKANPQHFSVGTAKEIVGKIASRSNENTVPVDYSKLNEVCKSVINKAGPFL